MMEGTSQDTPPERGGGSHAQTLWGVSLGSAGPPPRLLSEATSGRSAQHGFSPRVGQAGQTSQGIQSLSGA